MTGLISDEDRNHIEDRLTRVGYIGGPEVVRILSALDAAEERVRELEEVSIKNIGTMHATVARLKWHCKSHEELDVAIEQTRKALEK